MTKSLVTSIIMIAVCVLILAGSCLMGYFVANPDRGAETIQVDLGKGGDVVFENLALLPGEKAEYEIELKGEVEALCDVTLEFKEKGNNTLKNFVYAKIEYNGEVIAEKLLAEFFDDDEIKFETNLRGGKVNYIKITYYMPIEVDNEAENAEADFVLRITAANED